MTKEELAAKINGREYGEEMTTAEERDAEKANLLVIFGASDDLCELRGAIHDEVGANGGTEIFIHDGQLLAEVEEYDCEVLMKHHVLAQVEETRRKAVKVEAFWCRTTAFSWEIQTSAPHAKFEIMEEGEGFCQGIVLDLSELANSNGRDLGRDPVETRSGDES